MFTPLQNVVQPKYYIVIIIEVLAPSVMLGSGTDVDNLAMEFEVSYTLDNEQQFWDGNLNHPIYSWDGRYN